MTTAEQRLRGAPVPSEFKAEGRGDADGSEASGLLRRLHGLLESTQRTQANPKVVEGAGKVGR
jgi:hypothetical protein